MEGNLPNKTKVATKYMVLLYFALFFWASAFVTIRSSLESYSPEAMALLRFLVASVVLLIFSFFKKLKRPELKDMPMFILGGLAGITIYHVALNIGEQTVTAATASFIIGGIPIFTGILSIFFLNEFLKKWGWIGIFISFVGIGIISFSEGEFGKFNWGTLLVALAAIVAAIYTIIQKKLLVKYRPLEVSIYTIWIGTILMLFFLPDLIKEFPNASLKSTLEVVYMGIFPAAIAYVIWTYVLPKFQTATHITTYLYFNPILTMIIAFFWIKEIPNIFSILGGIVVLIGVILTNTKGKFK